MRHLIAFALATTLCACGRGGSNASSASSDTTRDLQLAGDSTAPQQTVSPQELGKSAAPSAPKHTSTSTTHHATTTHRASSTPSTSSASTSTASAPAASTEPVVQTHTVTEKHTKRDAVIGAAAGAAIGAVAGKSVKSAAIGGVVGGVLGGVLGNNVDKSKKTVTDTVHQQ